MAKNKLTQLQINEVSLVDKGAIGEVFTILKMDDDQNSENVVKQLEIQSLISKLENLPEDEFSNIMKQMMLKYNEINKGGSNMNEEQIKDIIKTVMDEAMQSVNKNFSEINKTVEGLSKKVDEASSKAVDPKTVNNAKDEDMEKLKDQVCKVNETMEQMSKALDNLANVKKSVDKLNELNLGDTVTAINKKLEDLEKVENGSNQVKETVAKSDNGQPVPFWKSILGSPNNQ